MPNTTNPKLSTLNIANVIAYILNAVVTYGVGVSGIFPTNAELSAKYQSLITPASFAFSIWAIIFISELIFAVAQATEKYRASDLVTKGVGYMFVAACVAQILWSITFAAEYIPISLLAMVSILIPLVIAVRVSSTIKVDTIDYWLLKFPLQIHVGWIMAATLLNVNVVLVFLGQSAGVQLMSAWASLFHIVIFAVYYIVERIWVVPCVLAWASYGISSELKVPRQAIADRFEEGDIAFVQMASYMLSIAILVGIVIRLAVDYFSEPKEDDEVHDSYVAAGDESTNLVDENN